MVGPSTKRGLDEAFRFAVRSGRVGPREALLHAPFEAESSEGFRAVAQGVVTQNPLDLNSLRREPPQSAPEEGGGTGCILAGENLHVREPRVIIDRHEEDFPSDAAGTTTVVAVDAMTDLADFPEPFRIDMNQASGVGVLVAPRRISRTAASVDCFFVLGILRLSSGSSNPAKCLLA